MSQRQIGYRYLIVISLVSGQGPYPFFRPLMIAHHNGESCYHTTGISRLSIYSGTKLVVRLCLIPLSCLQFDYRSADFNLAPGTGNNRLGLCSATPCFVHLVTHVLQPCLQVGRKIVFRKLVFERIAQDRHGYIIARHDDKTGASGIVENIVRRTLDRRPGNQVFAMKNHLQRRNAATGNGRRLPERNSYLPGLVFGNIPGQHDP